MSTPLGTVRISEIHSYNNYYHEGKDIMNVDEIYLEAVGTRRMINDLYHKEFEITTYFFVGKVTYSFSIQERRELPSPIRSCCC